MAQSQAYAGMVGAAARGQPASPESIIGSLGGPMPIPGMGAGLDPAMAPETHRFAGMGVAAMGGVATAGMAAAAWGSMSFGFKNMGHRGYAALGVLDPFTSAAHGFTGGFRRAAINAGGDAAKMVGFKQTMTHGYGALMQKGGLRTLAGGAARAIGTAGVLALPAMALGAGVTYGLRQAGAGAGEFLSTSGTMHEIAGSTGMSGGFSARDVGRMENTIQGMLDQGGNLGQQRTEMMGLMRTAGAAGEFGGIKDIKQMSGKFKKLVSEYKAVAKMMDTDMASAYSMAKSFKGLGFFDSGGQRNALAQVSFGARGSGLSADTIMTGMATGMQMAPGMGIARRAGSEMGGTLISGIGYMLKKDRRFAESVFESTGLQGDQAALQMSSQWMGHRAQMQSNPITQSMIAASMGESGQVDEWKLNQILSGGMSGEALVKAGQKAMKDKRIASMVATRGGEAWRRINQVADPQQLAQSLSRMTSEATGMSMGASMMAVTGMDSGTYDMMSKAARGSEGAAVRGRMEGFEDQLKTLQSQQIRDMIDPRKIVGREWNKIKNRISAPFREAGRELMQKTVQFVEEQTANLQSQLLTYTDPGWNEAFRTAFSGGGVTDFVRGATFLGSLAPGYGSSKFGAMSLPLSSVGGLGGVGGAGSMPINFRGKDDIRFGTSINLGAGGKASSVTMSPFQTNGAAWNMDASQREVTRSFAGSYSQKFYQSVGEMGWKGQVAGAMVHPVARVGLGPSMVSSGFSKVGQGLSNIGADLWNARAGSERLLNVAAKMPVGAAQDIALARAVRLERLAGSSWLSRGANATAGLLPRGIGLGGRAVGFVSKWAGPVGWAATSAMAGWDAFQYTQDMEAKNLAVKRDGWYGYAAGAGMGGKNSDWIAPTPNIERTIRGDIKEFGADTPSGGLSVFASSFVGGFGEMFSPGFTTKTDDFFGVAREIKDVRSIKLSDGDNAYIVGDASEVETFNKRYAAARRPSNQYTAADVPASLNNAGSFSFTSGAVKDGGGGLSKTWDDIHGAVIPGYAATRRAEKRAGVALARDLWRDMERGVTQRLSSIPSASLKKLKSWESMDEIHGMLEGTKLQVVRGTGGVFSYPSKEFGIDILFAGSELDEISTYAMKQAQVLFGPNKDGTVSKRMDTFKRDLQVRSKAWSPQVQHDLLNGNWTPAVEAELRSVSGGSKIVSQLKGISVVTGGVVKALDAVLGPRNVVAKRIAAAVPMQAIAKMLAGGSADLNFSVAESERRFGDIRQELVKQISKDTSASGLLATDELVRGFTGKLSSAIGAGTIDRATISAAAAGDLSDEDARKVFTDLGMEAQFRGYQGGGRSWRGVLQRAVGAASTDQKRQMKEFGEAWQTHSMAALESYKKSDLRGRTAGLGFTGMVGTIDKMMEMDTQIAKKDAFDIGVESETLLQRQSDITNEFYSKFGAMDEGQRSLMMRHVASDSALQGRVGAGIHNINMGIGLGQRVHGLRKKKGKKAAGARLEALEGMAGSDFGATGLDVWGVKMDDPMITLDLQRKMGVAFAAKYQGQDVTNLTQMATEYLKTGGGNTDKDIQTFMTKMMQEMNNLGKGAASPQTAEVTANTKALDQLTRMMSGDGEGVFKKMAASLADIKNNGFKMNLTIGDIEDKTNREVSVDGYTP